MIKELNLEGCEYFGDSELPKLVLAVKDEFIFKRRKWLRIAHQTAGVRCNQHPMIGTILEPREEVKDKIRNISDYWLDSNCGAWGVSLNELVTYRKQLQELLGVDCNISYEDFEEAIYPIDCTQENLKKLAKDKLPKDLDKLIKWENNSDQVFGIFHRWKLYILGENCD